MPLTTVSFICLTSLEKQLFSPQVKMVLVIAAFVSSLDCGF